MALIPEDDIEFLKEKEFDYELVQSGQDIYLIIHHFPFPLYVPKQADILIRLLSGYPQTPLDMFYTIPDVRLPSGSFPDRSDPHVGIGGKHWQQWSRHSTWRVGIDNLRSFVTAVVAEISKGI
jgi:hypothetical protein